ncbi:phage tail protein I [Lysinibacillus tabacifolii]|uniref:Phage tail protein I n=1 Tax=Lysinibacillus tabacifolii TaxID=1173107 RepID=A0ABY2T8T0_9BACI|nr:phage tail protein I [Lysinibacillus tabacifolii]TKI50664.1 phage tail protein I [Lysinibacillus tabacifolii]
MTSDILKLLPYSLRQDPVLEAIAEAAEIQLKQTYQEAEVVSNLVNIDEMPGELLDLLAFEKHVDFYQANLPIDQKRNLVKSSISLHRKKGTPAAIQQVFNKLALDSKLKEWFQYGGEPYYFKIEVNIKDKSVSQKTLNSLIMMINEYKNIRSHLEKIEVFFTTNGKTQVGACSIFGEDISVFPWQITNIDTKGIYRFGLGQQFFDTTTIFPKGGI